MILIAHRGNTKGPLSNKENCIHYIQSALDYGFDVEVDIWFINNKYYLGHDFAESLIDIEWLRERASHLWIHCKNQNSFFSLSDLNNKTDKFNFFWHENDAYTMTSLGYIWTYPGAIVNNNSILNMPELSKINLCQLSNYNALGVCSDYIDLVRLELVKNR